MYTRVWLPRDLILGFLASLGSYGHRKIHKISQGFLLSRCQFRIAVRVIIKPCSFDWPERHFHGCGRHLTHVGGHLRRPRIAWGWFNSIKKGPKRAQKSICQKRMYKLLLLEEISVSNFKKGAKRGPKDHLLKADVWSPFARRDFRRNLKKGTQKTARKRAPKRDRTNVHAVCFKWDTAIFFISASHIFNPNVDINCPILCPTFFPIITWYWAQKYFLEMRRVRKFEK